MARKREAVLQYNVDLSASKDRNGTRVALGDSMGMAFRRSYGGSDASHKIDADARGRI